MVVQRFLKIVRPILVSALLLFAAANVLQYGIAAIIPSFNILASKDLGKIIFTLLVFGALGVFVYQQPPSFRKDWVKRNFLFLSSHHGLQIFFRCFLLFFTLHALFLGACYWAGVASFLPIGDISIISLTGKLLFGFAATFMLAFTEEIMFRGTIYPYLTQWLRPLTAVLFTSLAFMIVHFLPNPVVQLAHDWPIAIGLFLLGFMLNLIFIKAGTMYANMGTHAGLVFVKVILRKIRFIAFAPLNSLPWFLHSDLRQAPLVHLLFGLIIVGLCINMKTVLFKRPYK